MAMHRTMILLLVAILTPPVCGERKSGPIERHPIELSGAAHCLCVSIDGGRLAATVKKGIVIYDIASRKPIRSLVADLSFSVQLTLSRDGELLLYESGTGIISSKRFFDIWRVGTGELIYSNRPGSRAAITSVNSLAQSVAGDLAPDGKSALICSQSGEVYRVDIATSSVNRIEALSKLGCVRVLFTPSGSRIICSVVGPPFDPDAWKIQVVDAENYHLRQVYEMKEKRFVGVVANDQLAFAVKGEDPTTFTIIDADTSEPFVPETFDSTSARALSFFRGGTSLMLLRSDRFQIWNRLEPEPAINMKAERDVAVACNGSIAVMATADGLAHVWDFAP